MRIRRFNWPIWAGFLLSLIAFFSYFFVFVWFPVTRDFPWVNLLLFALAAVLLLVGIRRAFAPDRDLQSGRSPGVAGRPSSKLSKIAAAVLAALSVAIFGFFIFSTFIVARRIPVSSGHPQVGQKAPDFTLSDTRGKPVALSELLSSPVDGKAASSNPKGVLLVFYRGYWWPSCNSELRSIQKSLAKFEEMGIRPVAISVDSPEVTRDFCEKAGYTFTFLSDPNADLIRRYDLLHAGAGIDGQDIARPAEFLLDASGIVRWVNLTENYWVRARPEQILEVARSLPSDRWQVTSDE
jgi:peroxiredoxin